MKSRSKVASYATLDIHGLTEKFEGDSTRAYRPRPLSGATRYYPND